MGLNQRCNIKDLGHKKDLRLKQGQGLKFKVTTWKSKTASENSFYHTMHYSAKRGLAIACRLSVCLFVSL